MPDPIPSSDEGGTYVTRKEWLHMRDYFRVKDGSRDTSGSRKARNRRKRKKPPSA